MAHSVSHSIARFDRMNRPNLLSKDSLRHHIAMAKYQARREIDLQIAERERVQLLMNLRLQAEGRTFNLQVGRKKASISICPIIATQLVYGGAVFAIIWLFQ